MVHPLIGAHAFLGELGIASFLWVFIELLNPDKKRVQRAKIAALLGTIFIFASWLAGGYYYVQFYGDAVKPIIKAGPQPWAHSIFTEIKEHVFLFLPFLSLLTFYTIKRYEKEIIKNNKVKRAVLLLSIIIIIIGAMMAGMGYLISSGARTALEATV